MYALYVFKNNYNLNKLRMVIFKNNCSSSRSDGHVFIFILIMTIILLYLSNVFPVGLDTITQRACVTLCITL